MITADQFDQVWPMLEPALSWCDGGHTKQTVWDEVEAGQATLWAHGRAAIVWKILDEPSGQRVAFIWLVGGELEPALELEREIEAAARHAGCTKIRGHGREGWARKAPGYRSLGRVYTKDL